MRVDDVKIFLRKQPFRPFRMTLTNGTSYEVHHPEMAMVGLSTVTVGLPHPKEPDDVYDRLITISLSHIMQIESLATADSRDST